MGIRLRSYVGWEVSCSAEGQSWRGSLPELGAVCCEESALGPVQLQPPLKPKTSMRKEEFLLCFLLMHLKLSFILKGMGLYVSLFKV